jgi:hypothetical protein
MNGEHQTHDHGHEHGASGATPADEEELRARLEEELSKITVTDVLVQTVVTLINLGGQRLGLSESTKAASDPGQTRVAIEAVRALLPLLEADERMAAQIKPVRDALAQLQMAYAQKAGATPAGGQERGEGEGEAEGGEPKPSGRLWVPPGTKT